jgi:hypothetical protein
MPGKNCTGLLSLCERRLRLFRWEACHVVNDQGQETFATSETKSSYNDCGYTLPIRFCVSGSRYSSPISSVARPDSLNPGNVSRSSRQPSLLQANYCGLFAIQSPISHNRLEVISESLTLIDTGAPSVFAMSATTPTYNCSHKSPIPAWWAWVQSPDMYTMHIFRKSSPAKTGREASADCRTGPG